MQPKLSYVICTAPRTGSTLLSAALWQTNVAGRPAEYFDIHAHNEAHWIKFLDIKDRSEYLSKILQAGMTVNGVFGLKLHWHQSRALMEKLVEDHPQLAPPPTLHTLLQARIGPTQYIWLRRKNFLAQAISYYRAIKTDMWRVTVTEANGVAPAPEIPFDFKEIQKLLQTVEHFDRAWHAFFIRQKLRALVVIYEDFINSYETTVRGVLRYLGLDDTHLTISPPQYRQQADALSSEWEQRYRQMMTERKTFPPYTPGRKRRTRPRMQPRQELPLLAYDLGSGIDLSIEAASPVRGWMDATPKRFAYRCLPLVIANQHGWFIRNSHRLTAIWDGTAGTEGIRISHDESPKTPYVASHFGAGILTFSVGCLFRTPPGFNLHVRGPANAPKDAIAALEGIVETDWARATFTMNWKFTRADHAVTFEVGEPIAMISPIPRGDLERFRPEKVPIAADPEWQVDYNEWSRLRSSFNAGLKAGEKEAVAAGWQRHYLLGMTVREGEASEHQTSLSLAPFLNRASK